MADEYQEMQLRAQWHRQKMHFQGSDGIYEYDGETMQRLSGMKYQAEIQPRHLFLVATGRGPQTVVWAVRKSPSNGALQSSTPDAESNRSGLYALGIAVLGLAVKSTWEQARAFLGGLFHRR